MIDITNLQILNEYSNYTIILGSLLISILIFLALYNDKTIKLPESNTSNNNLDTVETTTNPSSHHDFKPTPKLSISKMKDDTLQHKVNAAAKLAMQDLDPESVKQRHIFMSSDVSGLLAIHMRHLCSFNKIYFNTSSFQHDEIIALVVTISVNYVTKQSKTVHVRRKKKENKKENEKGAVGTARKKFGNAISAVRGSDSQSSNNFGFADVAGMLSEGGGEKGGGGNDEERENTNSKGLYGGNTLSIQSGKAVVGIDTLKNFQVEIGKMRDDPNNYITFDLYYEDSRGTVDDPNELNRVKLGTQEFHAFDFIGDMNGSKTIVFANKQNTER